MVGHRIAFSIISRVRFGSQRDRPANSAANVNRSTTANDRIVHTVVEMTIRRDKNPLGRASPGATSPTLGRQSSLDVPEPARQKPIEDYPSRRTMFCLLAYFADG